MYRVLFTIVFFKKWKNNAHKTSHILKMKAHFEIEPHFGNKSSNSKISIFRSFSGRSSSIPKNKQELKDMLYNKMLPDSLKVPVVVRVCNEDPEILKKHQEIQQSKSVHELSKISNLNELPLPLNIQLPDVPLPSLKSLIGTVTQN